MNPFSRNSSTSSIASQQFKATRLWDEIVFAFSKGVPVKRHRRRLRSYDSCFVAKKAVDWLQSYLTFSPHFANQTVTRCQVVSLLKKFLEHAIISRVDGNENAEFEDNRDLYRLTCSSPTEDEVLPPVPELQITSLSSSHKREHQYGFPTQRQGQALSENNSNISIANNRPFFSYTQPMSVEYENAHKKRQYLEPQVKADFSGIKRKQKENEDTVSLISARFINPSPPMTSSINGGNLQAAANTLASVPAYSYISKIRSHKDGKSSFSISSRHRPTIDYDDDNKFWL